jgi:hypothetical protein
MIKEKYLYFPTLRSGVAENDALFTMTRIGAIVLLLLLRIRNFELVFTT